MTLSLLALTLAASAQSPPPDLRGTWRMDLRIVSEAHVPVLGTTVIKSRTTFLVTVSGTADAPQVHTDPCHLEAEPSRAIARTTIPRSFIDALPEKDFPAVLTATPEGWAMKADMKPQYLGYDAAASPEGLPEDADHPAVRDLEGDGKPGGTIHLDAPVFGLIELYVVQRAHTVLDAKLTGADVFEGGATVRTFGQRTIGASNRLFAANADVTVNQSASGFRWARVPDGTTCPALVAGLAAPTGGRY